MFVAQIWPDMKHGSLTRLPQYTKHRKGASQREDRELAESLPQEPCCPCSAPARRQGAWRQPSFVRVQGHCPVLGACGTLSCGRAAGAGRVSSSWLAEPVCLSIPHCPPHSAGDGSMEGRYQLCCWGMQFPGSFWEPLIRAQIISACSFNEEMMSRDSSSKPNLPSSPFR